MLLTALIAAAKALPKRCCEPLGGASMEGKNRLGLTSATKRPNIGHENCAYRIRRSVSQPPTAGDVA